MPILSFPTRGRGGDAAYRGNCAPQVYLWLLRHARARSFLDPCLGSGTGVDVALDLGLRAEASDLATTPYHRAVATRLEARGATIHLGVDATSGAWLHTVQAAELVVAHPAYGTQVPYNAGPDDMSALGDGDAFLERLQALTMNMRERTLRGGHYVVIIGDTRKRSGTYYAYQAELLARMPRTELRSVTVKAQHNTASHRSLTREPRWGSIDHETILIWERQLTHYAALWTVDQQQRAARLGTWRQVVARTLSRLDAAQPGSEFDLETLYREVAADAPAHVHANDHYMAKIRQTLARLPTAHPTRRGMYVYRPVPHSPTGA